MAFVERWIEFRSFLKYSAGRLRADNGGFCGVSEVS